MSNESVQRPNRDDPEPASFETGAFISENAVRGALRRGPRARGRDGTATPAGGRTILRRWSVAELIARAVPRPPAGGTAH